MRRPRLLALAFIGALAFTGTRANAQTITKSLIRTFNQCTIPATYVFDHTFFTATGPEAILTLSRNVTSCAVLCPELPPPYSSCGVCNLSTGDPCPSGFGLACSKTSGYGICYGGVNLSVGYVSVIKSSRFCAIAACASQTPIGCPPSTCDGSGDCSVATSNSRALCICSDPACPIGQRICDTIRPVVPASDLVLEAFGGAANGDWVLGQAQLGSTLSLNKVADIPTALAQVRFPTTPGQEYVVTVKWTPVPFTAGFQNCSGAALGLALETRPDSCGP